MKSTVKFAYTGTDTITASVMSGTAVMWVCETVLPKGQEISVAIKRLTRRVMLQFPGWEFDVVIPLEWLL
jgi:hypothetical protein